MDVDHFKSHTAQVVNMNLDAIVAGFCVEVNITTATLVALVSMEMVVIVIVVQVVSGQAVGLRDAILAVRVNIRARAVEVAQTALLDKFPVEVPALVPTVLQVK